jgi:ribonuclease HI
LQRQSGARRLGGHSALARSGKGTIWLGALKKSCNVTVYTDSQYVQKGMSQWLAGWKAKDFKIKGGGMRPNHDLWRELDAISQKHTIEWRWVKGHAGHAENERADELARRGIENPDGSGD